MLRTLATNSLLRLQVADISQSELRWDFANTAAAVALITVAIAAIGLFFFRRKTGDRSLIYFGWFCLLYAVRLLALIPTFREMFAPSEDFWDYFNWFITCTIVVPMSLFLYQVVSGGLRDLIRWLLVVQISFAVFGIIAPFLGARLGTLHTANDLLVVATTFLMPGYLLVARWRAPSRPRVSRDARILLLGFFVWLLFVVHANLHGLRILGGKNVEFVGFLFLVGCLGYVSAARTLANEEQLVSINKELDIARQIQSSTLPRTVPKLAGFDMAVRYAPMSAVAGDFYDFICVDAHRVGVLVADVTGHGVPAALIASMLKVAFAAQAEHAQDPARLLTGLNQALCGKFEEHFVTAAYLLVDLQRRVLKYSAAGHPPMLMASQDGGGAREVEENGLMLGMFPEAEYSAVELPARAGDRCLLYTDGLFEAKNAAQEEYGKTRCGEFMEKQRGLAAAEFAEALLAEIATFSGHTAAGAQEDDITLLVVDIGPEPVDVGTSLR